MWPSEPLGERRRLSQEGGSLPAFQPSEQPSDLWIRVGSELGLRAPDLVLQQPHRGHRIPVEQGPLSERVNRVDAQRINVVQRCRKQVRLRQVASDPRRLERGSEGVSRLGLEPHPRAVHPVCECGAGAVVEPVQRFCHTHTSYLTLTQDRELGRQLREQLHVLLTASHRACAQERPNGEQGLRQRVTAVLGRDLGPEQID